MSGLVSSVFGGDNQGAQFQAAPAQISPFATGGEYTQDWAGLNSSAGSNGMQNGGSLAQQQSFINALAGQNGIQNQSDVYNQLSQIAAGKGPNPAQAMLNQATGANVSNQAALMAGQRGTGANSGLLARQAAQQGGALQQQAVGQGATMQANQSLGALNTMGGIAGQQVGQQATALQNYNTNLLNQQSNLLGAQAAQNQAQVGSTTSQNSANSQIANTVTQGQQGIFGSIIGAPAKILSSLAHGGEVKNMADGGMSLGNDYSMPPVQFAPSSAAGVAPTVTPIAAPPTSGPQSGIGKFFQNVNDGMVPAKSGAGNQGANQAANGSASTVSALAGLIGKGISSLTSGGSQIPGSTGGNNNGMVDVTDSSEPADMSTMGAAHGGKVPAMVSPGEVYIPPKNVPAAAKGADPKAVGEEIPGKAKVKGDSLKNDTVPKTLESGGMVIPRSIMNSKNAEQKAAEFVRAHLKQKGFAAKKI